MRPSVVMAAAVAFSALAGSVAAAPASAPESAPTTVSTPATATPPMVDGDKVVCKSVEVTGTRFPEQRCHTKREWADMTQAARDFTNKATTGPCTGGSCTGH